MLQRSNLRVSAIVSSTPRLGRRVAARSSFADGLRVAGSAFAKFTLEAVGVRAECGYTNSATPWWGMNPLANSGLGDEADRSCHVVSMNPGAVRGNHRHPDAEEWMILFGAPCTIAAARPGESAVTELRIDGARPVMIHFERDEIHAIRGEGPGVSYLIAYNDVPAPETVRTDPILSPST